MFAYSPKTCHDWLYSLAPKYPSRKGHTPTSSSIVQHDHIFVYTLRHNLQHFIGDILVLDLDARSICSPPQIDTPPLQGATQVTMGNVVSNAMRNHRGSNLARREVEDILNRLIVLSEVKVRTLKSKTLIRTASSKQTDNSSRQSPIIVV